jgi:hypothetical protein
VLVSIRAVIAIAFAASIMAASNAEAVTPARVIDKTFICSTSTVGVGIHAFKVGPGWVITPPGSQKDLATVYVDRDGQLVYARDRCRATPIGVPLNRGALPGPDIFGYSYSCVLPGEILVRVRTTVTAQHLDHSQLAVRLYKRSVPIAYATMKATGMKGSSGLERYVIRLWVSNRCNRTGG